MKTLLFFIYTLTGLSLFAQKTLGTDTIRWEGTALQAKIIVDTNVGNPDFIILDVRTPGEYVSSHIANSINLDYYSPTFGVKLDSLDHNKMYLVHCASGGRSPKARDSMIIRHFREIYHMFNGISGWITEGYPTVTGYTFAESTDVSMHSGLYTNNASRSLHVVSASDPPGKLFIFNLQGQMIMEKTLQPGLQHFDLKNLTSGVYIANIQTPDGMITRKISIM